MAKKYNPKLITARLSYTPSEIAELLDISHHTCLRWIKHEGLKVIKDNTSPLLVMGQDLKEFIVNKQKARKVTLRKDEYFCVKCQKAVQARVGSEKLVKTGKLIGKEGKEQVIKVGYCKHCGAKLNRFSRV